MFRNSYDGDVIIWSPQGRIHQIEYAEEAVKQGSATVGLKSLTHAVLVALKRAPSDLSVNQKKILPIDSHVGISIAGLTADARLLSQFMRTECLSQRHTYETPLPVSHLVSMVGKKSQKRTQTSGGRPFGVGLLVIGYDDQGAHLYQTCPSANFFSCQAMAIGARSQSARTYLERHLDEFPNCNLMDLIKHGLLALRDTLPNDVDLTTKNCLIGLVGVNDDFKTYEDEKIGQYLQLIEGVVRTPGSGKDDEPIPDSDTTLQDLPTEILDYILTKTVVLEVIDMKLVKSVWKEKADLVISRLSEVSSKWNSIVTSDFFRDNVYGILDNTAGKTIRMEILEQFQIQTLVSALTTLKDEVFIITRSNDSDHAISVFRRNNMSQATDVIQLPGIQKTWGVATCNMSSSIYVGTVNSSDQEILRAVKDEQNKFNLSTWIPNLKVKVSRFSVLANGCLVVVQWPKEGEPQSANIFDENGSLQHELDLSQGVNLVKGIVESLDGNIFLIAANSENFIKVTELNVVAGTVLRRHQSIMKDDVSGEFIDVGGKILLATDCNRVKLFDRELNVMQVHRPQLHGGRDSSFPVVVSYNSERNEIFHVSRFLDESFSRITIFRFIER